MKYHKIQLTELLTAISKQVQPKDFAGKSYVGLENIKSGDISLGDVSTADQVKSIKWAFQPRDILYGKLRPYLNKCVVADREGVCSTDILVLRPETNVFPKYVAYAMSNADFVDFANSTVSGMNLPRTTWSKINGYEVVMPVDDNGDFDLNEQKRIVNDFDQIQSLQKNTEVDIQKTSNLFNSISREFFSDRKLNLQKIKLSEMCDVIKGSSPTLKTPEGEYTFVVTSEKRRSANTFQFDGEAVCIPLVSSTGHGHASLHRIHYESGKFALANIMAGVVPKNPNELLTKYVYYYLSFYRNELLVPLMRGVANVTIPIKKLNDVLVDVPDLAEQKKIVSALEEAEKLKRSFLQRKDLVSKYLKSSLNLAFSET
ncbi:MAG: Type I restriction-modification enzyme, specificity subunit [Candidatus Daviesbacteria bacterium GW2011_GWB1_41_5]|uniref:Type I restriction-modification enzyme, specificity subunit n=1 Tax=Candidatus Daviesbacteria bacterium GW2011_GWB1_41_5 TaxID=1618429 RepID=A0A0G0ZLA3_9BACT|nr:MAG: Type I restriction-modification enzyme, specificity subunit [Candidatus Daviesbacteria bacterium GW2011_GWB1_41_5]